MRTDLQNIEDVVDGFEGSEHDMRSRTSVPMALFSVDAERDFPWGPGDNDNYGNVCIKCKCCFRGHKRALRCRKCHEEAQAPIYPMTTDIKPITAAELMDAAIHGKPIDPLRALAAYADPSNWVQCYDGEDSDSNKLKPCEWAFIGPTRPGYELAQHALSRLNDQIQP